MVELAKFPLFQAPIGPMKGPVKVAKVSEHSYVKFSIGGFGLSWGLANPASFILGEWGFIKSTANGAALIWMNRSKWLAVWHGIADWLDGWSLVWQHYQTSLQAQKLRSFHLFNEYVFLTPTHLPVSHSFFICLRGGRDSIVRSLGSRSFSL